MKTSEKIYWIKAGIAIIAAIVCLILQIYANLEGTIVFMLGTLVYLASSDLLSSLMKVERSHVLKIGIGAYIFLWLMTWTLLYTVIKSMSL